MDLQAIKQISVPVFKKFGITKAAVFGSASRNELNNESDVDFLVELPRSVHGYDYINLKIDLKNELEAVLGINADIVEYDLIKPELKQYILPTQMPII